jgi:AcrR family transcriptional regulator
MNVEERPLTARQSQVLDCTMELLREDGLGGLTIRKVAIRVGFSEAALYRHYSSKEALLVGLLERMEARLLLRLRELAEDVKRPVRLRIEDCIRHHLAVVLEAEGLPVLLLSEGAVYGDSLAKRVRSIMRGYFRIMEPLIEQVPQPAGSDLSSRERVMMLMGLPAITAVLCRALPSSLSQSRLKNEVVQAWVTCLLGVQPPEELDA